MLTTHTPWQSLGASPAHWVRSRRRRTLVFRLNTGVRQEPDQVQRVNNGFRNGSVERLDAAWQEFMKFWSPGQLEVAAAESIRRDCGGDSALEWYLTRVAPPSLSPSWGALLLDRAIERNRGDVFVRILSMERSLVAADYVDHASESHSTEVTALLAPHADNETRGRLIDSACRCDDVPMLRVLKAAGIVARKQAPLPSSPTTGQYFEEIYAQDQDLPGPEQPIERAFCVAAHQGALHALRWLYAEFGNHATSMLTLAYAMSCGRPAVMELVYSHLPPAMLQAPPSDQFLRLAYGHFYRRAALDTNPNGDQLLAALDWVDLHRPPPAWRSYHFRVASVAVFIGDLHLLDALAQRGVPFRHTLLFGAVSWVGDVVRVWEWLVAHGAELQRKTWLMAICTPNKHALQWLVAKRCPGFEKYAGDVAVALDEAVKLHAAIADPARCGLFP